MGVGVTNIKDWRKYRNDIETFLLAIDGEKIYNLETN